MKLVDVWQDDVLSSILKRLRRHKLRCRFVNHKSKRYCFHKRRIAINGLKYLIKVRREAFTFSSFARSKYFDFEFRALPTECQGIIFCCKTSMGWIFYIVPIDFISRERQSRKIFKLYIPEFFHNYRSSTKQPSIVDYYERWKAPEFGENKLEKPA